MMRNQSGFNLLELVVVVVIIGILAGFTIPNYMRLIEREARVNEAREVLYKSYAGYQRLLIDEEVISAMQPLTWIRLGMGDPNANARRFFNYNIFPDGVTPVGVRAERIGDAANRWLEINLASGALTMSSFYE